jgi:hypothetical protein
MAVDPQIVKKLTEDLDNLNDIINDVSKQIQNNLNKQFAATSESINDIVGGLEKGKDVASETAAALKKAQVENRRLGLDQNRLQSQLLEVEKKLAKNYSAKLKAQKDSLALQIQDNLLQQQINDALLDYLKTLSAAAETESKITEEKKKQNTLTSFASKKYKDIEESLGRGARIAFIFKAIVDAGFRFSKISTDIGKNLGYGADRANDLTNRLALFAQSSSNANITLQNAADAMNELSSSTGYVAEYSADALETQIMLTKQFGLTAEEAAGIYKFSVLTGKASSDVNKQMTGAFAATRNNLRAGVPFKAAMAEAAKVSGILASNLQNNPTRIVEAVVQAKALGTSLEQAAKQGEALLNFETSIESELKAELLTGKQINLERARAAALVGDQVTLTQELVNQVGSLEEFDRMNVLQKKAIAEAVGLTADELARQLQNQKLALESGKSLAQVTEEELAKTKERQDAQTKFNNAVTKLQDLIGNIVAGPLGQMLEMLGDVANAVGWITAQLQEAFGSTAAKTFLGALAGLAVGGLPGLFIGAGIGAASGLLADDMVGYGARTLLTPQGAVALNNNDTIVAGTNLFKGDDVMSFPKGALSMGGADLTPMINAINEVRAAVKDLAGRPVNINIDGKQVGTSLVQSTYKLA